MPISYAIKKYGKENFKIETLYLCFSQKELDQKEKEYVDKLNTWSPNGYNLRVGRGPGAMSNSTKEKISKKNMGKKRSQITRNKLSLSHMGQKYPKHEIERRKRFMKGKGPCQKARENSIESNSKVYYFLDLNDRPIEIYNMSAFCKEHKLSKSKMSEVANGRRKSNRGYRLDKNKW